MAFKRRRRKKGKKKQYFGPEQEQAVVDWLNAPTVEEKNKIFETRLKKPVFKIVESVINTLQIYSDEIPNDVWIQNAFSNLYEQMHKFNPSLGYKAYSYFGTIVRRYALNQKKTEQRNRKRKPSIYYGDIFNTFADDERYAYYENYFEENLNDSIYNKTVEEINQLLENPHLTEKELIMGKAIIVIFENWEDIMNINRMNNSNFEKKYILQMLRELTGFNTKDIRKYLKVFKINYFEMKKSILNG
jgi:DNA-directed RNA polymerase specialized sigma24 family protein